MHIKKHRSIALAKSRSVDAAEVTAHGFQSTS
jgi:hypothetical protein